MSDLPEPISLAADLLRQKRAAEAAPILIDYLKEDPNSAEGWYLLHFAVEDPGDKLQCLARVLALDPENENARKRMSRLQSLQEQQEMATSHPEQGAVRKGLSRTAIIALVIVGLLIGLGCAIFLGIRLLGGASLFGSAPLPLERQAVLPVTAASSPAVDPTSTPIPVSATSAASPTADLSTATPTASATFPPPDPGLADQMDLIQEQVTTVRQLETLALVGRYVIPPDQVRMILEEEFRHRNTKEELDDEVRVLSALGLVEPTFDMYTKILNTIGDSLGGFYVPWDKELFVVGTVFSGSERFVYSHEYGHALVDQHFNIDEVGVYPECLHDYDRCIAISALVEGDAMLVMNRWLDSFGTEQDRIDLDTFEPPTEIINSDDFAPPFAIREWSFQYEDGLEFVTQLYDQGGWDLVNSVYANLPASSEQVLHPEKYLDGETPILVQSPDLASVLGPDWRLVDRDSLGELRTLMVIAYSNDFASQIRLSTAVEAAAGWGGDQYQMLYNSKRDDRVTVVYWVWDDEQEAEEFWTAMLQYLHLRYRGRTAINADGDCWELLNDHVSCVYRVGRQTLWINAPDPGTVYLLREQYDAFK